MSQESFNDNINCSFQDYDLYNILNNKNNYSLEQLEYIFSYKKNILNILNSNYIEDIYKMILNLNIYKLNQIYMSDEIVSFLRKSNKLDMIYESNLEYTIID